MSAADEVAASPEVPASVKKAREAAAVSCATSLKSSVLIDETRKAIAAKGIQDLKLPRAPVSPAGARVEERRSVAADYVSPSPYSPPLLLPWAALPHSPKEEEALAALLEMGLMGLSFDGQVLCLDNAMALEKILSGGAKITQLNLARALDTTRKFPPPPRALVEEEMDRLAEEIGPEEGNGEEGSGEENVAKLQALMEKIKAEYTTYEAAIETLATRKFDRFAWLFGVLAKQNTITHMDMSQNKLGQPLADGRAQYSILRKLAQYVDDTAKLEQLDVSGNLMGPQGVGIIAKAMCKNITVHTLNLSGVDVLGETADEDEDPDLEEPDPIFGEVLQGLEALSEMLKKNKFLRTLALRNNRIKGEIDVEGEDDGGDTPFGKFLEPFRKYHRLSTLDLAGNELGPGGAKMLCASLELNHGVQTLDISGNGIGLVGLKFIASLLRKNKSLNALVMQRNDIVIKGKKGKKAWREAVAILEEFAAGLASNGTLRSLDISGHHLGPEHCSTMLTGFEKSAVTNLQFNSNDLAGDAGATEPELEGLYKILAATQRAENPLKILGIASNSLLTAGAGAVAGQMGTLEILDISRNRIGNAGATALLKGMTGGVSAIQMLDLSFNLLDDGVVFGASLHMVPALGQLNLAHNRFGRNADGLAALCGALGQGTSQLRSLDLTANQIGSTPSDVEAITGLLKRAVPPFSSINLMDNPLITLADVKAIIAALHNNTTMAAVKVSSQQGDRHEIADAAVAMLETNVRLTDLDLCFPVDTEDGPLMAIRHKLTANALVNRFSMPGAL